MDWHWDRIFAGAALTTLLGVGAELAAPETRQDGGRVIIAGRDSLQDSVIQVGQEMTRRNLNIQPTLTERPGLPLRIIVNRDLVLRPYQPLFFNRGLHDEHRQEAAPGAAAQDRKREAGLCGHARADLRRSGRCGDADPAHAGGVHGGGSGVQTGQGRRHPTTSRAAVPKGMIVWICCHCRIQTTTVGTISN